jgi:hypothetical protein
MLGAVHTKVFDVALFMKQNSSMPMIERRITQIIYWLKANHQITEEEHKILVEDKKMMAEVVWSAKNHGKTYVEPKPLPVNPDDNLPERTERPSKELMMRLHRKAMMHRFVVTISGVERIYLTTYTDETSVKFQYEQLHPNHKVSVRRPGCTEYWP